MDILVISDTHGRTQPLLEALSRVKPDLIFYLGDGLRDLAVLPDSTIVRAVRGNCDFWNDDDAPDFRIEVVGGYRFLLTHGHRYGVKSSLDALLASAAAQGVDAVCYGHTHEPFEKTLPVGTVVGGITLEKPLLVLCPGSLSQPARGEPSFATITLHRGTLLAGHGKL